jgi:hypothetical protein
MPLMGVPTIMGASPYPQPESWLAAASRGSWAQLDGKLTVVSVGADGALWGVNAATQIYRRRAGGGWESVGGSLVQVSCVSFDRAVGVNAGGEIFETQNGRDWRQIPGGAVWVSEGRDGAVFCCNAGGNAFRLGADRNSWTQLGGSGITQLSVGDAESVLLPLNVVEGVGGGVPDAESVGVPEPLPVGVCVRVTVALQL